MELLMRLLTDFVGQLSCILLCVALLKRKCSPVKWIAAFLFILVFGYIITSIPMLNQFPIKAFLLILAFTVFCRICYYGSVLTHLLCSLFSYAVMLCIDTVAIFIFVNLVGCSRQQLFLDRQLSVFGMLFSHISILVICFSIWHHSRTHEKIDDISIANWFAIQIFPLVSLMTIAILFQSTANDHTISKWIIIDVGALILSNVILMLLLNRVEQEYQTRKENALLQSELEAQLKTAKVLMNSHQVQRQMTHDFKHHLAVLADLLCKDEITKSKEYIAKLTNIDCVCTQVVNTNNPIIDAILNQKYSAACRKSIHMDFYFNDLSHFPLSDKECVVVLSNLIDNAIEACQAQPATRIIYIKLLCHQRQTILSVKNTTSLELGTHNKPLFIRKKNHLWHGYGLQNVYSILRNHGAFPVIQCCNGWFSFSVSLHQE